MKAELLTWVILLHLIVDWLFQNTWIAVNKTNLRNPAGWVHAGLHTLAMLFVFHWPIALFIGVCHLFIDTRIPLQWWAKIIDIPKGGEIALHIAIWRDQVLHFAIIGLAVLLSQYIFK